MKTALITCFFNALGYASRIANYRLFAARLKEQKVPLYTIEALFPGQTSALSKHSNVMTVDCETVLWQKESLLNLLIRELPPKYKAVLWCDADIYFQNKNWFRATQKLLNKFPVVQPYSQAVRLPRGAKTYRKNAEIFSGFADIYQENPQLLLKGDFAAHGHTGFVWAAHRYILENHGLYDAMIAGSGDHVMAHAFAGDFDSRCIHRILGGNEKHITHFQQWAKRIYPEIRGKIGHVEGRILHLWHGETQDRRYVDRNRELAAFAFDPSRDIVRDSKGLWSWKQSAPTLLNRLKARVGKKKENGLRDWAVNYFAARKEDG
jgi:hypothetical protein